MACPDLEQLEHFISRGPSAGGVAVRTHVDSCPRCRGIIVELKRNLNVAERVAAADWLGPDATTAGVGVGRGAAEGSGVVHIPGYRLIGEPVGGGQGAVYEAVQQSTGRRVAVKVMHARGFSDSRERARFEREVQVLGRLRHPNIVTIHDSGSVGESLYYVMDFIKGRPLDEHVASRRRVSERSSHAVLRRPSGESLELFATVCDAVHAAHLLGIIHRDLKPSNIRVDEEGRPHVLDFGLAKLASGGDDTPAMTVTGQFVGSLPWSSPEQADGAPEKIDARSDVYSLGVILYQLLTERFPYDVTGRMRDVLNRIVQADPVRPSTVRREIDGELETIVLKCLAKEPGRRYQSAGDLARDIRLYMAGEPIEAKRDSGMYVLGKTLKRHRVAVAMGAALAVVLVAATVVSGVLAWAASRQSDRADRRADEMKESADMFDVLVQSGGDFTKAEPAFRLALEESRKKYGDTNPFVAMNLFRLAQVVQGRGNYAEAERLYGDAAALRRGLYGDNHPMVAQALAGVASVKALQGDHEAAVRVYREALTAGASGEDGPKIAASIALGRSLLALKRFAEAEAALLDAQRMAARSSRPVAPHMRDLVTTMIAVYDGWAALEPGGGYEKKSEEWRKRLGSAPVPGPGQTPAQRPRAREGPRGPRQPR